jgi:predicted ArsR family transcriptional regulator
MSDTDRDDRGRYTESVSEQEILKVFDRADAPFLTASELADQLPFTKQAANHRLQQMHDNDHVERKQAGGRSIGWWATVAPAPSEETLRDIEATEGELERGETTSQEEMKRRLGIDG